MPSLQRMKSDECLDVDATAELGLRTDGHTRSSGCDCIKSFEYRWAISSSWLGLMPNPGCRTSTRGMKPKISQMRQRSPGWSEIGR